GLRGEALYQLDLLVAECPDLLAINDEGTYQVLVLEHRHGDERARAAEIGGGAAQWIALPICSLGAHIVDVNRLLCYCQAAECRVRRGASRASSQFRLERGRNPD